MKTLIVSLFLFTFQSISGLQNPGFKARITDKGLDYATTVASKVLTAKIGSIQIPDVSGKSDSLTYSLHGMKVTSFRAPVSSIRPSPKVGLVFKGSGASLGMEGSFDITFRQIITIHDSGTFDLSATDLSFSMAFTIGKDKTGRPTIKSSGCTFEIGSISITFHAGTTSFIYNLFKGIVEKEIRNVLQSQMCEILKSAIDNDAKNALAKLPVMVPIDNIFLLDYRFMSTPSFQNQFLETYHKGEVYWSNDVEEAPFEAPPMPTTNGTSKMVYLWMSDYVFNTIAYNANKFGVLAHNLTKADLPDSEKGILNTTCLLECIGTVIPEIKSKYPDSSVELHMRSTSAPKMAGTDTTIMVSAVGLIDFYVKLPKGDTKVFVLRLSTKMTPSLDVWIAQEKVHAKLLNLPITLNVVQSNVGPISDMMLNFLVKNVISLYVEPKLNDLGAKGFPLPVFDNVHFENTELKMEKDTLLIATDVIYNATEHSTHSERPPLSTHSTHASPSTQPKHAPLVVHSTKAAKVPEFRNVYSLDEYNRLKFDRL